MGAPDALTGVGGPLGCGLGHGIPQTGVPRATRRTLGIPGTVDHRWVAPVLSGDGEREGDCAGPDAGSVPDEVEAGDAGVPG